MRQSKGRKEEVEWGEMKGVIQTILREGQEGGREKEEGWWDEECRRGKKEVRRELRKWRKTGAERYREAKRGYNRLCERKRRKEGIGGRRW